MVAAFGISGLTHRDLPDYAICDSARPECMMHLCADCPREDSVFHFCTQYVPDDIHRGKSDSDDHDDFESKIWLKQWITTDRCTLVDVVESREDSLKIGPKRAPSSRNTFIWLRSRVLISKD